VLFNNQRKTAYTRKKVYPLRIDWKNEKVRRIGVKWVEFWNSSSNLFWTNTNQQKK